MKKEAYYFSHDSNARNDEKILALRMKHGAEGYGVYFMIIERLRESTNYASVKDYNILAYDLRVSASLVKSVVEDFGLFELEEKHFFSPRLKRSMARMDSSSINGIRGNLIRYGHITRDESKDLSDEDILLINNKLKSGESPKLRPRGISDSHMKRKEKKVKENKVKERENTRATDLLKNEKQSELETFVMQNKNQIEKWDSLVDNFNDKMEIELSQNKIEWEAEQLMPRFRSYVRSWISNQAKEKQKFSKQEHHVPRLERF